MEIIPVDSHSIWPRLLKALWWPLPEGLFASCSLALKAKDMFWLGSPGLKC